MQLINAFINNRRGTLLQVMIGLVIMGVISYAFWSNWENNMTTAGTGLKTKIESDNWLAE